MRSIVVGLVLGLAACSGQQPGVRCPGMSAQNPYAQGFGIQCPLSFATAKTSLCSLGLPNSIYRSPCEGGYQLVQARLTDSALDCYYGADGQLVAVIGNSTPPRATCLAGPSDFAGPMCGKDEAWC
jgi:hypothetical protein